MPSYRLRANDEELPAVAAYLDERGWRRAEDGDDEWTLWWDTDVPESADFEAAGARLYNHLPGSEVLGVKSRLATALDAARTRAEQNGRGEAWDFFPRTYLLPGDHGKLQRAAARMPGATWIRKPKALSRGRGVEVIESAADAGHDPENLIQEYVAAPHLLDGYKYSLRCYLLVTSLSPLVAWLFDDGFCKFASRPFSLTGDEKLDRFRHLTNPDVLMHDASVQTSSRNLTHRGYRERLRRDGHDDAALFSKIRAIAQKTLVAARDEMLRDGEGLGHARRFDLYGLDITVDERLEPILIECNICPSLAIAAEGETQAARDERQVKRSVSHDLMNLVGALDVTDSKYLPKSEVSRSGEAFLEREWPGDEALDSHAGIARLADAVRAQTARAGGFARIFPAAGSASLLADFEAPPARDVALSAALGLLPRFFALGAVALEGGEGALLAGGEHGYLANLNAEDAELFRQAIAGIQILPPAQPEAARRIAAWCFDRFLAAGENPPIAAAHAWNRAARYALGDAVFTLRTPGGEPDNALGEALAELRCGSLAPGPNWDVARHPDGFALHDPRGRRRWRGELDGLTRAVSSRALREAALRLGRLGWCPAMLLESARRPSHAALVLSAPQLSPELLAMIDAAGLRLAASPVFLDGGDGLTARAAPHRPGLAPRRLFALELGAASLEEISLPPFEARGALLDAAPELRATPQSARALCAWLAEANPARLLAPGWPAALRSIARALE